MSILRHIVGIAVALADAKDPYDKRVTPAVIGTRHNSPTVLEITANNYQGAAQFAQGVSIPGKMIAIVHIGRNKWEIRQEDMP
jgi:hypothetical protein